MISPKPGNAIEEQGPQERDEKKNRTKRKLVVGLTNCSLMILLVVRYFLSVVFGVYPTHSRTPPPLGWSLPPLRLDTGISTALGLARLFSISEMTVL